MSCYNIVDFGAKGDGTTKNTLSIQAAVDACLENGGGTVTVPAGNYLSGSIRLKSNINLCVESGAKLISCIDPKDILADEDYIGSKRGYFIGAIDAENVSITGLGEIYGQGELLSEKDDGISEYPLLPGKYRAHLCYFRGCSELKITGVTLSRSASWTVHLIGCKRVTISEVNILNLIRGANNDGIDPDSCKDVKISGCHIEGGDDAIVIKTTKNAARMYGSCEDIIISDCTLVSRGSAVKIGTETCSDIRNCVISGCIVRNSNRGVGIWVRDGGTVENILISNMVIETRMFRGAPPRESTQDWWGKGEPIFMSVASRKEGEFPGKIRNVSIRNITAECENSVFLQGNSESPIEDVMLDSLRLHLRMISGLEGGKFDVQPREGLVYDHHNPAVYSSYVAGLTLSNVKVTWGKEMSKHWSNALCCENSSNLLVDGLAGGPAYNHLPTIMLNNVKGVKIDRCISPAGCAFISKDNVDDAWVDVEPIKI